MWARKRLDISAPQLATRLVTTMLGGESAPDTFVADCFGHHRYLPCLSVRSGFDLLLESVRHLDSWPDGSEIIFSGLTIPDIPRIAREHGLVAIGTDIDLGSMAPRVEDVESKITSKTKALVVAHLLGSKVELDRIAKLARQHDLLLIEDCAQSFTGQRDDVSELCDVSMFSFGAIKTNTAVGGAALIVKDEALREAMHQTHERWPTQSRWSDAKRAAKYLLVVKPISTRPIARIVRRSFQLLGTNHDSLASNLARGFAGPGFFDKIRRQPSPGQIAFLHKRLSRFDVNRIDARTRRGALLTETIVAVNPELDILGRFANSATHWIFAVAAANPEQLVQALWDNGFDASNQQSLCSVDPLNSALNELVDQIVFLPIDWPMPDLELVRMGNLVGRLAIPCRWAHG